MESRLDLSLSHSIRACRRLSSRAHSNFVPAFALLPADKRQAMEILYAYTRFTDDIADLPDLGSQGEIIEITPRRKRQKLNQWVGALEAVFGKAGSETVPQIHPENTKAFQELTEQFPGCGGLILLPALKMIVDRFQIPREPLFHLIDGIESDIEPKSFETIDDSIDYCHQVATSVGFAALAIWGTSEPLFSEPVVKAAKACGVAFQWTNIVRDMLEDYRNGRIYLPLSELQRFGLTEKQFGSLLDGADWAAQKKPPKKGTASDVYAYNNMIGEMERFEEKFLKLVTYQLDRCEIYYENSAPLYSLIHRDSRRTFGLMWSYYHALYRKMCRNPWLVTRVNRVRLSSFRRIRLLLRWRFLPRRKLR
jgi:phytoene synthase